MSSNDAGGVALRPSPKSLNDEQMFTSLQRKTCNECGEDKSIEEFRKRSDRPSRVHYCKKCEAARRSKRRRDNREAESEYQRNWRAKNADRLRVYAKVDSANGRSDEKITAEDVVFILEKFNNQCVECDTTENVTLDHIIALSTGGRNHRDNLQLLCLYHNSVKGTK